MFLVEAGPTAVLYTGDIRAEPHWVNALVRQPALLPYAGGLRRLDNLYLDTPYAVSRARHASFPDKAAGIHELLQKLRAYPPDTTFYLHAWTFGYEDVWAALAHALDSPVHLDDYRYGLYTSIGHPTAPGLEPREAALFAGVQVANAHQLGIFTCDPSVRLHSCEKGSPCRVFDPDARVVDITPIVSRHNRVDLREPGDDVC